MDLCFRTVWPGLLDRIGRFGRTVYYIKGMLKKEIDNFFYFVQIEGL